MLTYRVEAALEGYLEFKRMAFARFYLLSNEELLDVLAQTPNGNAQAVQPYINSLFDGIKSIDFGGQHPDSPVDPSEVVTEMPVGANSNSIEMYGMISPEGEFVSFARSLKARGEVQEWLSALESRCSVYLLDWYRRTHTAADNSANTDAEGAAGWWTVCGCMRKRL